MDIKTIIGKTIEKTQQFGDWARKQPQRQIDFFGSDLFMYGLTIGSVIGYGIFIYIRES